MNQSPLDTDADLIAPPDLARDQWLELRRQGVGGSDIGAIAGFSRYTTPFALWLDKRGELPPEQNERLERMGRIGLRIESFIAELFSEEAGLTVRKVGTLARPERSWVRVNLDRAVDGCPDGPCLLEIKNRSAYLADQWEDQVPDDTECQAHWGMLVTGWSHAHVAVLIGGNDFRHYRIERDQQLLDHLLMIGEVFWSRVLTDDPPAVGFSETDTRLLSLLYADPDPDREIEADPAEIDFLLKRRVTGTELVARGEDIVKTADNRMRQIAGDACVVKCNGRLAYTWKPVVTTRLDAKAVRREMPEIFEKFAKTTTGRRLHVPKGS